MKVPCILALFCLLVFPGFAAGGQAGGIVILHSYHHGFAWTDNQDQGIRDALQATGQGERDIEAFWLDNRHLGATSSRLAADFQAIYRDRPISVLLVTDNYAFDAVLAMDWIRERRIPVVFCGVNDFRFDQIKEWPTVTGVAENFISGRRDTLSLALRLQPGTKGFLFLMDSSATSEAIRREILAMKGDFPATAFTFVVEERLDRQIALVSRLAPDQILVPVGIHRDPGGQLVSYERAMELLSAASPVASYGFIENRIGHGLLGGKILVGHDHGLAAGQMAVRILQGTAASTIAPILDNPGRIIFDWNQLARFGIDASRIPAGATILNRPADPWQVLAKYLPFALIVFGLQVAVIILLLVNRRQLQRTNLATAETAALRSRQDQFAQTNRLQILTYTVTGMAQELSTPLGSLLLSSSNQQTLLHELAGWCAAQAPGVGQTRLATISRQLERTSEDFITNINHLAQTIERFRQLSSDQAHDMRREFRLVDIIGTTCELLRTTLLRNQAGIELLVDVPAEIRMDSYPGSLSQALVQLITNCIQHGFAGGRQHGRISVRAREHGDAITIETADDGAGIALDHCQKVFNPFFSTRHQDGSVGLGLSIVEMQVIDRLKGSVACSSEPDHGTTITMVLPRNLDTPTH